MGRRLSILLPGLAVAATGVGAGDLVTASLAGSELGLAVLWAAVVGAVLKGALNEGLARWQLATGETLLEGWVSRLGEPVRWAFLVYLALWSFVVGGALVNACGVATAAALPDVDPDRARIAGGVLHGVAGLVLVRRGGYRLFERTMAVCIAVMSGCVLATAVAIAPAPAALATGLVPTVPAGGTAWVLGVVGGVGGTVTIMSYGYWIREHGRTGREGLTTCRWDLLAAYALTAVVGLAMIVIGSRLELAGSGAGVAAAIGDVLGEVLGTPGRVVFLVGFWGAVFSSLLGVWQGVPYLFADAVRTGRPPAGTTRPHGAGDAGDPLPARREAGPGGSAAAGHDDLTATRAYRGFQLALAVVPLVLLGGSFRTVQLAYAVSGALFMPFLAATLLLMLRRPDWVPAGYRNGWASRVLLLATLALFAWQGARTLASLLA